MNNMSKAQQVGKSLNVLGVCGVVGSHNGRSLGETWGSGWGGP